MVRNETSQVNVKCPQKLLERIDDDIEESGEFRNRSEWIISAIRSYDDYRTKLKAERKIAESEAAKKQAANLGSVSCRTSTESNAN